MNKKLPKFFLWLCAASFYVLVAAAFFGLLREAKEDLLLAEAGTGRQTNARELIAAFDQKGRGLSAILLPLGPEDGRLPGSSKIWEEFLRAGHEKPVAEHADGFDGLQAVAYIEDFSRDAVAELFLSGSPRQVFRRGSNLLFLNSAGTVQVIDCENPRQPRLSDPLPYRSVSHMEMQGNIAYLLLTYPEAQHSIIVVADLETPRRPRELTRLRLSQKGESFYLAGRQMVVSGLSPSQGGKPFIELYDVSDDYRVAPIGTTSSALLMRGFLKFGDYLLVPDLRNGIHVCDFSDPLEPVVVASIGLTDTVRQFVRHGNLAFVMGGRNIMYVIDMRDPTHPEVSSVVEGANHPAYFIGVGGCTYYFTPQGSLQVFSLGPANPLNSHNQVNAGLANPLLPLRNGAGFALLGGHPDPLPEGVAGAINLADVANVVDSLVWNDGMVLLQGDGLVRLMRAVGGALPQLESSIQLPAGQSWLAEERDRLYVGGQSSVSILALDRDRRLVWTGQFEIPAKSSWDGLTVGQTLCIAAGKEGLLTFSLEQPDKPEVTPTWVMPVHLESLLDVRQLASPGGHRLLAAAGPAGLLDGKVAAGRFQLTGLFSLRTPVSAVTAMAQLCLAATTKHVTVLDIRKDNSFQNLGEIAFPGVTRLAAAPPGYWAGFVPDVGWTVLPAPHILVPGDSARLETADLSATTRPQHLYLLNLFNDHGIYNVTGLLHFPPPTVTPATRTAND